MTPKFYNRKSSSREADSSRDLLKPESRQPGRSANGRGFLPNGAEQRGKTLENMLATISWKNPEEFVI